MANLPPPSPPPETFLESYQWVFWIAGVLSLAIVLHIAVRHIYKKALPKIAKTHFIWDSALMNALPKPMVLLLWTLAITYVLQIFSQELEHISIAKPLINLRSLLLVATVLWFALRFIKEMETAYIEGKNRGKKRYDKTTVRAVCQITRITAFVIALLVYMQSRNINISAILTVGGASGVVIGFAAKDLMSNFFGGLMLYLDRPFSIGDWIRSPDREIEGTVEHIGFRVTRIRTFSQRPLYIPNGVFLNIAVENPSRMFNRQIKTHIGIRYEDADKMELIVSDVEEMIRNHPMIDTNKYLMVRFDEFGPCSINFQIYCFTKTTNWADYLLYQQDVYLKTIKIIHSHGAKCALPTRVLHFPKEEMPLSQEGKSPSV